jgi:glycosyltransferase involved in cell wall biosynthesis
LPAYHIYRFEDLSGIEYFKENCAKIKGVKYPRITLSMIMKNEADHYLRAVLLAAKDYITDAVIIDDASTDNTVELIQQYFQEKNIPGIVIYEPFKDFGYNRTFALDACNAIVAEYILLLDADMVFGKTTIILSNK